MSHPCTKSVHETMFHKSIYGQVVFGHSKQLWALAPCHDNDCYVTAGYDKLVVKWSDHHKVIWKSPVRSRPPSPSRQLY